MDSASVSHHCNSEKERVPISEISDEVKRAVDKAFEEITGRQLEEGSLEKQLAGFSISPADVLREVKEKVCEILNLEYPSSSLKTIKDRNCLYQLFQFYKDSNLTRTCPDDEINM